MGTHSGTLMGGDMVAVFLLADLNGVAKKR